MRLRGRRGVSEEAAVTGDGPGKHLNGKQMGAGDIVTAPVLWRGRMPAGHLHQLAR
jgi:hypothetical protein